MRRYSFRLGGVPQPLGQIEGGSSLVVLTVLPCLVLGPPFYLPEKNLVALNGEPSPVRLAAREEGGHTAPTSSSRGYGNQALSLLF